MHMWQAKGEREPARPVRGGRGRGRRPAGGAGERRGEAVADRCEEAVAGVGDLAAVQERGASDCREERKTRRRRRLGSSGNGRRRWKGEAGTGELRAVASARAVACEAAGTRRRG
ncbi:hypothetical protein DAI22_08g051450 [Oryza sativa Japonica Group]|nr:hypothetical protein DAI22_08g051450 [Oryza sativa Japonica Group]